MNKELLLKLIFSLLGIMFLTWITGTATVEWEHNDKLMILMICEFGVLIIGSLLIIWGVI